jgi:RNA polymerase sigma-70 factor, ECF subfamily
MTLNFNKGRQINVPFSDKKFKELFDSLYLPLCNYSYRLVKIPEIAEDIVQEQFIYFWENYYRLSSITSPDAYLFKSVKNKSLNYLKKQLRKYPSLPFEESPDLTLEPISPSVIELLENKELSHLLEKAIDSLPFKCRSIFAMKKMDEMSNKEIADSLGISAKTVEAQMTIALKRIAAYLSKYWYS